MNLSRFKLFLGPTGPKGRRLSCRSRAAEGGRPKAFDAKRKSLQGRADLRAAKWSDPPAGRGSPKKIKNQQ
ncbi:hypothetical protein SGRA_3168 [Saprospira grandis str. Lewin]|uniref:Uncharacterized protein n=1 Tax=Saprospira grandis (strain Lewin) TaxID=984262 RepID=H6L0U0_SAPGL|nr:hypothetical protein SGRA_3168 [Saprospira grandis str. Lewin]